MESDTACCKRAPPSGESTAITDCECGALRHVAEEKDPVWPSSQCVFEGEGWTSWKHICTSAHESRGTEVTPRKYYFRSQTSVKNSAQGVAVSRTLKGLFGVWEDSLRGAHAAEDIFTPKNSCARTWIYSYSSVLCFFFFLLFEHGLLTLLCEDRDLENASNTDCSI